MSKTFNDLLAMDALAQRLGCGGLNPRLREAMEADARWPTKRAGPPQDSKSIDPDETVTPLQVAEQPRKRPA
ncbi:MAG: hypothetical protein AAF376_01875 [Pseudomonadota bacterium]